MQESTTKKSRANVSGWVAFFCTILSTREVHQILVKYN